MLPSRGRNRLSGLTLLMTRCIAPSPMSLPVRPTGVGVDGLVLGDTVGRTPGAYGFVISCPLTGYLNPTAQILSARLVIYRSSSMGINPLGNSWVSAAGPGPAKVLFSMVRRGRCVA